MTDEIEQREEVPKSRKRTGKNQPVQDSKWRQQKLAAYRPVFNATSVFPWTTILGAIFLGIGILLFVTNLNAKEIVIDYTNCRNPNGSDVNEFIESNDGAFISLIERTEHEGETTLNCQFRINLTEDYFGNVKIYYGLRNFYQNTRGYVKSRSDIQLAAASPSDLLNTGDCGSDDSKDTIERDGENKTLVIAPCGKIAFSMFNDTFKLTYKDIIEVPLTTRGMVHETDMAKKFKNPPLPAGSSNLCDAFANTTKPKSWPAPICEIFSKSEAGQGFANKDFQVWMEPAALPHFRKIYRLLDREADIFSKGLPKGEYTLTITYNYPVEPGELNINKTFIIAIETWAGPKNLFLPIAYIIVGGVHLFISAALFGLYIRMRYKSD
ncbi:unnamed protein product, partial [Mesorhabditis belari]|uniref:Cell cycle control protein 50A n=1 Tax=Mesorhabditis belari TaxID=2138241 RepID=A0AAF3EC12_9BILA